MLAPSSSVAATTAQEVPDECQQQGVPMPAAEEGESSVLPGESTEQQAGEQKGEAGLAESSKAIVAAMLNQDNPDGTDAALMVGGGGNETD